MKRTFLSLIVFLMVAVPCLVLTTPGCTSTAQKQTYKTLYSLEATTTAAFDSYAALIVQNKIRTNNLWRISRDYNAFQAGMQLAIVAARGNSNSVAPPDLIQKSASLITDITTEKKGTP